MKKNTSSRNTAANSAKVRESLPKDQLEQSAQLLKKLAHEEGHPDEPISESEFEAVMGRAMAHWFPDKARAQIELLKLSHTMKPNPLNVWEAYWISREIGEELPDWILDYFYRVADNLIRVETTYRFGRISSPAAAAFEALEMKPPGRSGRRNVFTSRHDKYGREFRLALNVYNFMQPDESGRRLPEMYAVEETAKSTGLSKSTVWRAWREVKQHFAEISGPDPTRS